VEPAYDYQNKSVTHKIGDIIVVIKGTNIYISAYWTAYTGESRTIHYVRNKLLKMRDFGDWGDWWTIGSQSR